MDQKEQDDVIVDHMESVEWWVLHLGRTLQPADVDDLRGDLFLSLVETVRAKLDPIPRDEITRYINSKLKYTGRDFFVKQKRIPKTSSAAFDVPDGLDQLEELEIEDMVSFVCANDTEEKVGQLLLQGFTTNDVAAIIKVPHQRISDLKERIFGRVKRKISRLANTTSLR